MLTLTKALYRTCFFISGMFLLSFCSEQETILPEKPQADVEENLEIHDVEYRMGNSDFLF